MTPEGRVKKAINAYLNTLKQELETHGMEMYISMFVPTGYGKNNSLDYHLCIAGHFVAIEAKAPGEWLTNNQRQTARNLYRSGATVFVISGPEGLASFQNWVKRNADWFIEDRGDARGEGPLS